MTEVSAAYEFTFRGLLAEEALDRAGRPSRLGTGMFDEDIANQLSLVLLDEGQVASAKSMAAVYIAVAPLRTLCVDWSRPCCARP